MTSTLTRRPTPEMIRRFRERTLRHIALVKKNLLAMEGFLGLDAAILAERGDDHDRSKFEEEERDGYSWLTWAYRCESLGVDFDCGPSTADAIRRAMDHHRARNRHHPEAHPSPDSMTELDLVEMVCDWTAIAQENDGESAGARDWATANITRKWNFSRRRTNLIFEIIDELDRRNRVRAGKKRGEQIR